jgi:hypothetical protein
MNIMKRAAIIFAALTLFSCASSDKSKDRVKLELEQITGASSVQPTGRFDVQFGLQVENPTNEAVTLKSVEMTQIGSGSYQIRQPGPTGGTPDHYTFTETIAPGQTKAVSFWVHAFQRVLPGTFGASEPVTLRALVYFDSPSGQFHQVVQKTIGQFEGQ